MRPSAVLQRIPRRLASEVLQAAENPANAARGNTYFNELPTVLKNFFRKFPPAPYREYASEPRETNAPDANPFLANKHPITQRWHQPKYSMRRQADLWKAAYRFGIEHLMPPLLHNKKFYEERYAANKFVRGALYFKLKKGERIAPQRAKEVAEAVANADAKILERKGKRFGKFLENRSKVGF